MTEKGFWNQENNFGTKTASPYIPDVSGIATEHVRYARVNKRPVPLWPWSSFSLFSPPRQRRHQEKEEREFGSEEVCIKIEGSGTWILNLIFILSLKVP